MNTNPGEQALTFGSVTVPAADLQWRFSRSSGPGGQHVNTSATRVTLSVDLATCRGLGSTRRERALERLSGRLNEGVLSLSVQDHRSQARNRDEARERMAALLAEATAPPPRRRRPSGPSRSARRRRVEDKRHRGRIKRDRARPAPE